MPSICWEEKYSVEIQSIDRQHQGLFDILAKLEDAMKRGEGGKVLAGILDELLRYAKSHFALEERYFQQYGYPDATTQIEQHSNFVDQVDSFIADVRIGGTAVSVRVLMFLTDWIRRHISTEDKKYSAFLRDKGVR